MAPPTDQDAIHFVALREFQRHPPTSRGLRRAVRALRRQGIPIRRIAHDRVYIRGIGEVDVLAAASRTQWQPTPWLRWWWRVVRAWQKLTR